MMSRVIREQAPQVAIVGLGGIDQIERAFPSVIIAQCLSERAERIDFFAVREGRSLAGDFIHQFVDIFELLERGPLGIARAPVRAWPQPYGKSLGEILVGVALRIP